MKLIKVSLWIIVCICIPLIYFIVVNPLLFGYLFSSITSSGKSEVEKEVHRLLESRYHKVFEMVEFDRTNLHGTFMGRVFSMEDGIVFNVFQGQSKETQNDYMLKAWAKPVIDSVVKNNYVEYEVEYDAPSLFWTSRGANYWDTNFIENPSEISLKISFMFIEKMSREQAFNILKKFKLLKIGKVSLVLYPAKRSPNLEMLNRLGFEKYYLNNTDDLYNTCQILNHEVLNDVNLFQLGSSCLN